jgi:hypothetical protein
MQNRWAMVGGILSVVSGAFGILGGLAMVLFGALFGWLITLGDSYSYNTSPEELATVFAIMYGVMGAGLIILSILALIGGIFAIRRKAWGLALAGAIAAVMVFFPIGVVSVVFISMARLEFLAAATSTPANTATPLQS